MPNTDSSMGDPSVSSCLTCDVEVDRSSLHYFDAKNKEGVYFSLSNVT